MDITDPAMAFPSTAPSSWPRVADRSRAQLGLARWREVTAQLDDPDVAQFARAMADQASGRALLDPLFANSPFLGDCLLSDAAFLGTILERGPNQILTTILAGLRQDLFLDADRAQLMRALRKAKRRAALTIGLADIFATWDLEQVTNALTGFAEAALSAAVAHLLRKTAATGAFALPHPEDPERDSGLVVLGMGKLGAYELNYSSDIDLILLYDREKLQGADDDRIHSAFVRLARELVAIMEERTADGYVLRTDLRLRPDPGVTPLAIPVTVAESYYGSVGQNWERAAMIKARPVAGDREAARQFLGHIRPFIWRRHLDFAAIQDIHSIKRQIAAHRGGHAVAIKGHNIKLGRGGIREIEFIAQTLQLIWGGREPALRVAPTCQALTLMADHGKLERAVAVDLIAAYRFLRRLEHRLQMVDDKQTHAMPADDAGIAQVAAFMAFDDPAAFTAALEGHLRTVERRYAHLFETAPTLGAAVDAEGDTVLGNLVFTGAENDPDTLATLKRLGFSDPPSVADRVRSWHHGRFRAMRSARARELLTELMPGLLAALGRTAEPDRAFARFDEFLGLLPAGVQILSLFQSNPALLDLVADIMGSAPMLAEQLARNPILLDGVLGAGFAADVPPRAELEAELDRMLERAEDFQDVLDLCRRWSNDHKFHLGLRMLRGQSDAHAAGPAMTELAEIAIDRLLGRIAADFMRAHGRFGDAELAVVALGKLGAREMTVASDLDLIFVYGDTAAEASDGPKPLPSMVYFARLSQRLITALTAPTAEGKLYDVDMRLRPSGNQGPIASAIGGFRRYQESDAWTWEHMALSRARPIAGPPALRAAIEAVIRDALTRPRDADKLVLDVADMRARMAREFRARDLFDVKHARGGLVDCDFIAQYLQLRHAHADPAVLDPNTCTAFRKLARAGKLDHATAEDLIEATALWHRVQGLLRLTVGDASVRDAPVGVRRALALAGRVGGLEALEARMRALAEKVTSAFEALIERPAAAIRAARPEGETKGHEEKSE
ncbi:MAG: bifunctional [glutamine synthetase] adenylyltransferase/[glutamine synthetase]-adenylyl-L-tyrosine phosphorylase [Alphaproteobacteria bacterium]|nr:bifunctional [glutamine synthetase] adenylyltransferase/[glutamine synthetase]-adenylyl-L-tyrosine phosphorylase [Alphaproteobacteria bacterium]